MTYKGVCWMCVWGCVCECVSKTHTYSLTGKIFKPLFKPVLTHTVIKIQVYPRCARNCSTDKYVFWYFVYILIHHIKHFLGNNYMMECISNKIIICTRLITWFYNILTPYSILLTKKSHIHVSSFWMAYVH